MTETPRESQTELTQKDVDRSAELDRAEVVAKEEENAPNREPVTERVGPAQTAEDRTPGQAMSDSSERAARERRDSHE